MPKLYTVVEIDKGDLDDKGQYVGSIDLSDTELSIRLAPNLGTVRFPGSVKTRGSLSSGRGTTLKTAGDLEVAGEIDAGNCLEVAGNINAALSIVAQGHIYAGRAISAGGRIVADGNIKADKGISAGGAVRAAWSIMSLEGINAYGTIEAGGAILADGPIKAGKWIFAGQDIKCWDLVQARGEIRAKENISARKDIRAGDDIFSDGSIVCGGSVVVGGRIVAATGVNTRHSIQAGCYIKARWLYAGDRIFAGMKEKHLKIPGDDEVRGEILNGLLAHGQHVQPSPEPSADSPQEVPPPSSAEAVFPGRFL